MWGWWTSTVPNAAATASIGRGPSRPRPPRDVAGGQQSRSVEEVPLLLYSRRASEKIPPSPHVAANCPRQNHSRNDGSGDPDEPLLAFHPALSSHAIPSPRAPIGIVAVLLGLGLIVDSHVEHALLDLGVAGDLGELPIVDNELAEEVARRPLRRQSL
jgi:hypothetical protein